MTHTPTPSKTAALMLFYRECANDYAMGRLSNNRHAGLARELAADIIAGAY